MEWRVARDVSSLAIIDEPALELHGRVAHAIFIVAWPAIRTSPAVTAPPWPDARSGDALGSGTRSRISMERVVTGVERGTRNDGSVRDVLGAVGATVCGSGEPAARHHEPWVVRWVTDARAARYSDIRPCIVRYSDGVVRSSGIRVVFGQIGE
jgi:hypothetical protein